MKKYFYVVIDTNVIVSGLISKNENSPPVQILKYLAEFKIIPVFSTEILKEYEEVLQRPKFKLPMKIINQILNDIKKFGLEIKKIKKTKEPMIDPKDTIFYAVTLSTRKLHSLLVTGNLKHFPAKSFVLTPAQFIEIIHI